LLQHLLLEAASASPDRVALYGAREERTYAELEDESARIAAGLAEFHVGPGDLVGLVAEKTPRTVAAAYAILRRGAAYVPLDPTQPRLRIGATIERFGLGCVVTDAELVGPLRDACDASASSARRFVSTNELAEAPRGAASDARTTDGALDLLILL
jgi:non-ribosomal peptide synthetase component F